MEDALTREQYLNFDRGGKLAHLIGTHALTQRTVFDCLRATTALTIDGFLVALHDDEHMAEHEAEDITVQVWGPNVGWKHGATFEAHDIDCQDNARLRARFGGLDQGGWTVAASNKTIVAESAYADQIDEGSMTTEDALSDIYFAPCLDDLPVG